MNPWFLILCGYPGWSTTVSCFLMVVHESVVLFWKVKLSSVLQKKSSMSCRIFSFPASFAYLNPFQQWLYDFEIHLFTLRTIEELKHNYYRRFKHSLKKGSKHSPMLQKETRCIKNRGGENFWTGWRCPNFSYFVEIYIFFPFSTALR